MRKLHYQSDQEELVRAAGQMTALVENDRHIKSAASSSMSREMLSSCKPDKDHVLIHLIAMGDHEHYGPNRNGDAWPKAACAQYHPTFVSHGHMFREHRNRDAKTQGIGLIKASSFDPDLGRIELAVWAHKKKAADVIEKVASGKSTSYSMSARVPYDRSSITGKLAKTPAEYDDYCKYRMGQYIPEFKKYAFVYNDKPTFFDISYVQNPADRIAHYLEYQMDKAASAEVVTGVELAKRAGVCIPDVVETGCRDFTKAAMLNKLVELEKYLDAVEVGQAPVDARQQFCKIAGAHAFAGEVSDAQLAKLRTIEPGTLFNKLARRQVLLPFVSFVAYATGRTVKEASADPVVIAARGSLGSAFRKLAATECCDFESLFEPASEFMTKADLSCSDEVDKIMDDLAEKFSTESGEVGRRAVRIAIDGPSCSTKCASATTADSDVLAVMYSHYKLAALKSFRCNDTVDSVYLLSVLQNRNT